MKHWIFAACLICFGSLARAQNAVNAPAAPTPTSLGTVSGTAMSPDEAAFVAAGAAELAKAVSAPPAVVAAPGALQPADWVKLGGTFGSSQAWQFGFDKSATAGVCAFLGLARGQSPKYILGPCRDFVILTKNKVPLYHIGVEALGYDVADLSHSHPYYLARFGMNVGPANAAFLSALSNRIPYLESVADWNAPKALQYLGDITTVDGGGGPGVGVKPVWGAALKVNIPLIDLYNAVVGLGGK